MSRSLRTIAVAVLPALIAFAPCLARTDDPAAAPAETAATAMAPAPATTPMLADIDAVLREERTRVDELTASLATAAGDEAALALHRAVEQVKMEAQLRILGIQADYARREGRIEDATRIEAAVAAMGRIDAPTTIEERPAPASSNTDGR